MIPTTANAELPPAPRGYKTVWHMPKETWFRHGAWTLVPERKLAHVQLFSTRKERETLAGPDARFFDYKQPVKILMNGTWVRRGRPQNDLERNAPTKRALTRKQGLLSNMPAHLRQRIKTARGRGVMPSMSKYAFSTPVGVSANCYAFFLSFADRDWRLRQRKLQPGYNCNDAAATTPLQFPDRMLVSKQLHHRILCDNPDAVHFLNPGASGYPPSLLTMPLPGGFVLGIGIVGDHDFHFLRREGVEETLNSPVWKKVWNASNQNVNINRQLIAAREAGEKYCWAHIAGWSGRVKLVDASHKIITNPVHVGDRGKNVRRLKQNRCNHVYSDTYDTTVGFFVVKAGVAAPIGNLPNQNAVTRQLKTFGISPVVTRNGRKPAR